MTKYSEILRLKSLGLSQQNIADSCGVSNKRMPDYAYIRKELLRNGVSKKLLWTEYMEDCRANNEEPLTYSQFCFHIQQDEQKHRATIHINRKPGEQVGVDWAERIGINAYTVVNEILTSKRVEQQTYRSFIGLLKLAGKCSEEKLEATCQRALSYTIQLRPVTRTLKHPCNQF